MFGSIYNCDTMWSSALRIFGASCPYRKLVSFSLSNPILALSTLRVYIIFIYVIISAIFCSIHRSILGIRLGCPRTSYLCSWCWCNSSCSISEPQAVRDVFQLRCKLRKLNAFASSSPKCSARIKPWKPKYWLVFTSADDLVLMASSSFSSLMSLSFLR